MWVFHKSQQRVFDGFCLSEFVGRKDTFEDFEVKVTSDFGAVDFDLGSPINHSEVFVSLPVWELGAADSDKGVLVEFIAEVGQKVFTHWFQTAVEDEFDHSAEAIAAGCRGVGNFTRRATTGVDLPHVVVADGSCHKHKLHQCLHVGDVTAGYVGHGKLFDITIDA